MANKHRIISINSGSSSLKFSIHEMSAESETLIAQGAVERIGLAGGRMWIHGAEGRVLAEGYEDFPDHLAAIRGLIDADEKLGLPSSDAIGHRLVHGGPDHLIPERVTPELIETLR